MTDADRPTSASGMLVKVRHAYDEAGRRQPDYYPMLPAWEEPPFELR